MGFNHLLCRLSYPTVFVFSLDDNLHKLYGVFPFIVRFIISHSLTQNSFVHRFCVGFFNMHSFATMKFPSILKHSLHHRFISFATYITFQQRIWCFQHIPFLSVVRVTGFEPAASCSQSKRADQPALHPPFIFHDRF